MYFNYEKDYCKICSDVVDTDTYLSNEGLCNECFKYTETCEECGELFHLEYMVNNMCENCYDNYRDELEEEYYI